MKGDFTLPGEAGYEDLTLELARRWGADAIRDSDGTVLSDKIISSGHDIYSTICLVRADNNWARANKDKLQQNYLMSFPVVASSERVEVNLLENYFREQFEVNFNDDPKIWWQVFDRTNGKEVEGENWEYERESGKVIIKSAIPWHKYTVNFLAYNIWEGISMYNHITNNWGDREHQMPVDPIYPETQEFILKYLQNWLDNHPRTKIVRFTSLFYNFAWFWGDPARQRFHYADWGSYELTVSPCAMTLFAKAKGYKMTSEDFVNGGAYCTSHNVPSKRLLDWMDFMNGFVVEFGRKCIDLVHAAGKEAYMFYDDHWVGTEPYGERFKDLNFDGLIKCVFNAFEVRLCSEVKGVKTRELRLHPYLFPTGLKGEPTFMPGGNPAKDAKKFWADTRRGLLRAPVDRIGLGGYLHLVKDFPDFVDAIERVAEEFRLLKRLHEGGAPYIAPVKVGILTAWGKLRSWGYVGHFIPGMELYEITEALAGLPLEVSFLSFDDIAESGIPADVNVLINAGKVGTAWSGGNHWKNDKVLEQITGWVAGGGAIIGVGEPSAARCEGSYFQLAHIFGVEREVGNTLSKVKPLMGEPAKGHFILEDTGEEVNLGLTVDNVYGVEASTTVLNSAGNHLNIAVNSFQKGRGLYLAGFKFSPENTRMLHRAIFWCASKEQHFQAWSCTNLLTECAYFPRSGMLVVISNSDNEEATAVRDDAGKVHDLTIEPYGLKIIDLNPCRCKC